MTVWLQIILSNITVALLVALLAWMVGRWGRQGTLAHFLWIVFFVKLVTPPLLWIPIAVPINGSVSTAIARSVHEGLLARLDPWTTIAAIWIFGTLCVFVPGLMRLVRFRHLLRREGQPDSAAEMFVAGLLSDVNAISGAKGLGRFCGTGFFRFRGNRGPRVLRLSARVSPMLFGFGRRAAIVCPDELWQSLSESERHALLAHEAAHYSRRDHWVRWLEWVVTALYWWFPGVYLARHQLERHEEAACDAWAVRRLRCSPRQYAEALLHVLDFLNERPSRVPRLASGMHATGILEQRLRLLMRPGDANQAAQPVQVASVAACLVLWLVHPSFEPQDRSTPAALDLPLAAVVKSVGPIVAAAPAVDVSLVPTHRELPDPPQGFWSQRCRRQWADFSLTLPGARLVADASRGIIIEVPEREPLTFSGAELSAIAEIPATRRVVIGDDLGRVRLWDLRAGLPVSLVGRHGAQVASLAYHASFGVISGDISGSVIRWDLQSGQVLAIRAGGQGPVQSVRRSVDNRTVAVLVGSWSQLETSQTVYFVDAASLSPQRSASVSASTAVVLQSEPEEWLAVQWSGEVRRVETGQLVATVAKHDVSALVLSQEANLSWTSMTPRTDPTMILWETFW